MEEKLAIDRTHTTCKDRQNMETAQQVITYVHDWLALEERYRLAAIERGDARIEKSCDDRIFTLHLLLSNIGG